MSMRSSWWRLLVLVAVAALAASVVGLHWTLFGYGWVLPVVTVSAAMAVTFLTSGGAVDWPYSFHPHPTN